MDARTIDHAFVEETPNVNGGYPVVRGTRTPVRTVVEIHRQLHDLDETLAYFDHLTREQIQGALDYYYAHPERVDEDIEVNLAAWRELAGEW